MDIDLEITEKVEDAANFALYNVFVDGAVNEQNEEEYKLEALGIAISKWSKWDAEKIFRVLEAALEDSNFSMEADAVAKLREGIK